MRVRTALPAVFAAALAAAACGDDPLDVGTFSVDGTWAGSAKFAVSGTGPPADTARYTIVLDLDQAERDVSGEGEVRTAADTLAIDVDGRWDYPSVDLRFDAPEFSAVVFDAQFATRDSLKGTLNGSGFNNVQLTLIRQP